MPFDNPHQTPYGDLELLMKARGRISERDAWVRGHFQKGGRYCMVASLSLDVRQPQLRYAGTEQNSGYLG
jgi:hypothetical protein